MKPTEEQIQAGIDAFYGSNKTGPLFAVRGLVEVILEAALSASPAGVVKPLEWELVDENHYAAKGLGLGYEVRKSQIRDNVRVRFAGGPFSGWQDFDGDIDAAKDAAFADYSARIMSAIEPAGVGVETPPPSSYLMGKIAALQEWSEQKYGQAFSISACHDLLNVLKDVTPSPQTNLRELSLELLHALCGELRLNRGSHQDLINRSRAALNTPPPQTRAALTKEATHD